MIALCACGLPEPEDGPSAPLPNVLAVDWTCADGEARVEAWADAWTRGGMLWLDTGERRERHEVASIAADADGSGDRIRLVLDIVEDPSAVEIGRTTAFLCSEAPLRQLYLISFDYEIGDCVRDPGFPEIEGVPTCEQTWP